MVPPPSRCNECLPIQWSCTTAHDVWQSWDDVGDPSRSCSWAESPAWSNAADCVGTVLAGAALRRALGEALGEPDGHGDRAGELARRKQRAAGGCSSPRQ